MDIFSAIGKPPSMNPGLRGRSSLVVVFLCVFFPVFLLVVVTSTLVTFILPESFASTARIKVERDITDGAITNIYDPYFIQTECEVIRSETILDGVVKDLDLNAEWGRKYAGGEKLRTSESRVLLQSRLEVHPVRNTSLIEILAYSEDPQGAAKIANAVAVNYRDFVASPRVNINKIKLQIIDTAQPGLKPVRPDKTRNIILGVVMGILLGGAVGGGSVWLIILGRKLKQKPLAQSGASGQSPS